MSKVLTPPAFAPAAAPRPPVPPVPEPRLRTPPDTRQRQPQPRPGKATPALWQNLRPAPPRLAPAPAPAPVDPVDVARAEAAAIVDEARTRAERLRAQTETQAAADGRQKARAQARVDLRRLTRQARALVKEARALREEALDTLSEDVAETAVALAKAVLMRKAEQSSDDLRQLAVQLLAEAREPRRLRAHRADVAALEGVGVPAEADPTVGRGGFLLFGAAGVRDARLESRIARLETALKAGEGK